METAYGRVGKRLVRFDYDRRKVRTIKLSRVIELMVLSAIGGFIIGLAIQAGRI